MPAAQLTSLSVAEIVQVAYQRRVVIPAFNIAYLPMVRPVVETVKRLNSFALVEVARPDIEHFGSQSYAAVRDEFQCWADRGHLRLHQDHVPVIDEEGRSVDWRSAIGEGISLGYDSVMIDGSRLALEENIEAARAVVSMAHPKVAVEAELGAVLGHEPGPLPSYEEMYRTGRGFTDVGEAVRFVRETGVDWLSVAIGNIHGAISGAAKDAAKVQARLNADHLRRISDAAGIPLVLHGGTGIELSRVLDAVRNGIAKVNIGTALRQPYEACLREGGSEAAAQEAVARAVEQHLTDYRIVGSAEDLAGR